MRKYTTIGKYRGYTKLTYLNDKVIKTEKEYLLIKPIVRKDKVLVLR